MTLQSPLSAIYFSSNPIAQDFAAGESWCGNATFCLSYQNISAESGKVYDTSLSLCMDYLYVAVLPASDQSGETQSLEINITPFDSTL